MSFSSYIPAPPLSDYVHMFWHWEGYHPPHERERILPVGMMELTINLCDEPFRMYYPEDEYQPHDYDGPLVSGPRSRFYVVDTSRPITILAVWFKPGGAYAFFGESSHALHNLHVPLALLWGHRASDLYEQLLATHTVAARFQVLEDALQARLKRGDTAHRALDYALKCFSRVPQEMTIAQVVDEIALSPTRFIQVFRDEIGMTPKLFCRVQRFQGVLKHIAHGRFDRWVDLALTCGYFDQSHFINDFQSFAGISPTQCFPQSKDHASNLPFVDES